MTFQTPEMREYYESLPFKVRYLIDASQQKITTMEELRQVGEQLREELRSDSKY